MKRYWVFGGEQYYADGGMYDFRQSFETLEQAEQHATELYANEAIEWWHVFDSVDGVIVAESESKPYSKGVFPEFQQ